MAALNPGNDEDGRTLYPSRVSKRPPGLTMARDLQPPGVYLPLQHPDPCAVIDISTRHSFGPDAGVRLKVTKQERTIFALYDKVGRRRATVARLVKLPSAFECVITPVNEMACDEIVSSDSSFFCRALYVSNPGGTDQPMYSMFNKTNSELRITSQGLLYAPWNCYWRFH